MIGLYRFAIAQHAFPLAHQRPALMNWCDAITPLTARDHPIFYVDGHAMPRCLVKGFKGGSDE